MGTLVCSERCSFGEIASMGMSQHDCNCSFLLQFEVIWKEQSTCLQHYSAFIISLSDCVTIALNLYHSFLTPYFVIAPHAILSRSLNPKQVARLFYVLASHVTNIGTTGQWQTRNSTGTAVS